MMSVFSRAGAGIQSVLLLPLYKSRIGRTLCSFMQRILLEFRRSSGYPGEGVGKKNGKPPAFRK